MSHGAQWNRESFMVFTMRVEGKAGEMGEKVEQAEASLLKLIDLGRSRTGESDEGR